MNNCPGCVLARTKTHHLYYSSCRGCDIRAMSNSPRHIREQWLNTLPKEVREEARQQVVAEWRRRKELAHGR